MTQHLLQSTLFAGLVAVVALALRNNAARVRHWLWLAASIKFLIPFSFLVSLGSKVQWRSAAPPELSRVMENVSLSLAVPEVRFAMTEASPGVNWALIGGAIWICGCIVLLLGWFVRWLRVRAMVRAASPMTIGAGIEVMSTRAVMEPGVFGILEPVLLLPEGIAERLTAEQLDAIVAHELCHVRRLDNLAAAIHMVVEAVFWFHPLVWWIGARLVEERERACDEEVLRLGNEPEVYAESILKVCRLYLESPLECVAGVTGSDLKKRVESIMTHRGARELDFAKKVFLAAAGVASIGAPVVVGIWNAPPVHAQAKERLAFEVASVKQTAPGTPENGIGLDFGAGGRMTARNIPLAGLIRIVYDLPFNGPRLTGMPEEMANKRFDIDARAEAGAIPMGMSQVERSEKMKLMVQTLLADRFKLKMQGDEKVVPVYAIVVGKNGPKLKAAKVEEKDCADGSEEKGVKRTACHEFQGGIGRGLHASAVTMEDLASAISNWSDRPVVNRTQLAGLYEIETEGWAPMDHRFGDESAESKALADGARPTLYMVLDRLGLKLESSKAPIRMYIVEHVESPSQN